MKIVIPVYGDHVSNVFDFAHTFLLVDIEKGQETNRTEIAMENQFLLQRAVQLKKLEADVLICGAISQELANMILSFGIKVFAFVTGNVDDVLSAYCAGQLTGPEYSILGCRLGTRKGLGRRGRSCRWQHGQR
jgi:predicted Fe-Mo cluster-binding NifX family protein